MRMRGVGLVALVTVAMVFGLSPAGVKAEELEVEPIDGFQTVVVDAKAELEPVPEAEAETELEPVPEVEAEAEDEAKPLAEIEPEALPDETSRDDETTLVALSDGEFAGEGVCGDDLTWTLDQEGKLTVAGTGAMYDYAEGSAPWCENVTVVRTAVLEPGVTAVGTCAFMGCDGLVSVSIPEGVTSIGSFAFSGCEALTSLTLPQSVTSIGEEAFSKSGGAVVSGFFGPDVIWELVPGWDVDTQKSTAVVTLHGTGRLDYRESDWNRTPQIFAGFDRLSVVIAPGVTSIANGEFCGWTNLVSVTVPEDVTTIESGTFDDCFALTDVCLPSSLLVIEGGAFASCTALQTLEIPQSVTSIGEEAFEGCSALQSITIPEGVTTIEAETFHDCHQLKTVSLPQSLRSIGEYAFQATGLNQIELPAGLTEVRDGAFKSSGLVAIEVPSGVETLWSTFEGCGSLAKVVLHEGLSSLGGNVFNGCRALQEIALPSSLRSIGGYVFENSGLTSITIPEGVTKVGGCAFKDCLSLESVNIADSVTELGMGAFQGCAQLKTLSLGRGISMIPQSLCWLCSSLVAVDVPAGVTHVGSDAFRGCTSLSHVTLPEGLLSIESSAFQGCSSLTTVVIPDSVITLGVQAFSGSGLAQVRLSENLTDLSEWQLGDYFYGSAFYRCPDLVCIDIDPQNPKYTSVDGIVYDKAVTTLLMCPGGRERVDTIPSTVTSIDGMAFEYCEKLTQVSIPTSIKRIGKSAFYWCKALETIDIPSSVTNIEQGAFGSSGLVSIVIPSGVTCLESGVFDSCGSLSQVTIPTSVREIAATFASCTSLRKIEIPESVTTIGENAFRNTGLWDVTIPASVTSIGKNAFCDCADLKEITILNKDVEIGSHAFGYRWNDTKYAYYRYSNDAIYGYTDSTAERYAAEAGIDFASLGSSTVDIATCTVLVGDYAFVSAKYRPNVTVRNDSGVTLVENQDYTLQFKNADKVGTATAIITGSGNYAGEVSKTFKITKSTLSGAKIVGVVNKTYTGSAITQNLEVRVNGTVLSPLIDYVATYKDNVKVGTASISIKGKGNYSGNTSVTFAVKARNVSTLRISKVADQAWTGKAITPKVTVKHGSKTLVKGTDYTITYKGNVSANSRASVTVKGKGNYTGTSVQYFSIGPKTGTWQKSGTKWWFRYLDGSYPKSELAQIGGASYYFDASGYMVTGWKKIGSAWYYFEASGKMATSKWVKSDSHWCYVKANGKMATGWLTLSGKKYYLNSIGYMITGWQRLGSKYYYFESSGQMATNKWVGNYWLGSDGVMATDTWVDGGKYYVGTDGAWVKGKTK